MAVSLLLSGCSAVTSIRGARASASSTAAVASNIPLCDLTTVGKVEEKLGQQVEKFTYEHSSSYEHNNTPSTYASYGCWVYGFSEHQVETEKFIVKYKTDTDVDVPALYDAHTYAEAKALQRASRFTLDGIQGEGVTIPLETNNWAAVWQYPDGTILTVLAVRNRDTEKISNGGDVVTAITEIFAPKVPDIAAGPTQEFTFYPVNENTKKQLGIVDDDDIATPRTPWPSPSR
ncbi:hypothetical protein [Actinomyces sp. ZJ308]|uniref:hypothetical protein n=1 Tax=Actinomyces sp. ZJ308 TaxID=2708342 RepID=UPI001423F853|nr:hypothetical protein [Actinomyces sp. ZJ308]